MGKTRENTTMYRIRDMEKEERPRERLASKGPADLYVEELLAILLRTGLPGENAVEVARRLLDDCGGLAGLHRMSVEELSSQRGIGLAKACQIKASLELGFRLHKDEKKTIGCPEDAARLVIPEMSGLDQEQLWVLLLDTRNHVFSRDAVYKGSLNTSTVRVGELFKKAVRLNAASVILVHNHPSGDPSPSPEDVALTREAVNAGRLLGVEVLDHIIVGGQDFISLKQKHTGFSA